MSRGSAWPSIDVDAPMEGVRYEVLSDGIAVITLDRPERGNALAPVMVAEMRAIWERVRVSDDIRVVIVTVTGERHFCTGADMRITADDGAVAASNGPLSDEVFWTARQNKVWKPVIAAVNGVCAGGGLHFVADADIVIAAADATFLDPHVSVGQVTAFEAIGLMAKMPVEAVMRMALVGRYERIDAERAYQLGMISQIVDPPGALRAAAQELAEQIAKNSPAAMAATKRALWGALELGLTDACRAGAQELVSLWGHPDQEEGPLAFAEKREARWSEPGGSNR
jgi:enoyl-CoA hydratase